MMIPYIYPSSCTGSNEINDSTTLILAHTIEGFYMEVKSFHSCQCNKITIKNGKFISKLSDEIPWNKLCVDLLIPYKVLNKIQPAVIIKAITIINIIIGCFEIIYYINKNLWILKTGGN